MGSNISKQRVYTNASFNIKELFDNYYSRLVHFAFQLLHDKNQAEDVAQDAFVKLFDNRDSVSDHPIALKNFLYSSCKNNCFNILRHLKVTEQHVNLNQTLPTEEAVISTIIRSEVIAEIHQAIALLPDACQQIFKLCYLDEMKNSQVADLLGISVNTVKTQKQRALKVLRVQLAPELYVMLAVVLPELYRHFYFS